MKNTKIKSYIVGAIILLGVFANTSLAFAQVSIDVDTVSKSNAVTQTNNGGIVTDCTSATINGYLGLNGSESASVWFEWGPTQSLGRTTARQTFYSDSNFSQIITGLTEGTTYYYRAVGENDSGIEYGDIKNFTVNCPTQNPTVDLTADSYNVNNNGTTTVRWTSQNATSCTASGGVNGWSGYKSTTGSFFTGSLTSTTTYNITCSNSRGSANDSVTITVNGTNGGDEPTVDIRADDTSISSGDSTIIRWTSQNADYCTASNGRNGWSGSRNLSGSFNTRDLDSDTTYRITCTNNNGSANDSVTVRVDDSQDEPTVRISANPTTVQYNGVSYVTWNSENADTCTANGGANGWSGNKNLSGSFYTGSLTYTTTFRITCRNDSGSADDSVTVNVNNVVPVNNQPTVIIYADQTSLNYNGATNIRWSTTNATTCNASGGSIGWAGVKSIGPGSFYTGSLTSSRTYSITCSNEVGSSTDFVTVNVRGRVLGVTTTPTPRTSLLLVTSSVDRNRPIVPTLDNTNPCPGDEINYSLNYQNVGNGSITNLVLRLDLPMEVDYMYSSPNNPNRGGQTLIFNLGTLRANGEGTVTVRVRLRDNVPAGTSLNFPATLNYVDASGYPQSVNANVNANVCGITSNLNNNNNVTLGATVFGAGFLPTSIFGWLLLIILILILILLARYLFGQSFQRNTVVYAPPAPRRNNTANPTH